MVDEEEDVWIESDIRSISSRKKNLIKIHKRLILIVWFILNYYENNPI